MALPKSATTAQAAAQLLPKLPNLLILTGAGISTPSGIPDYRGPNGAYSRTSHRPITYQEFTGSISARQRYWARSFLGYPRMLRAKPNCAHSAVRGLELLSGRAAKVITQNVDLLHRKAGSEEVLEMHGSLDRVRCLGCGWEMDRATFQKWLVEMNPDAHRLLPRSSGNDAELGEIRPDGDVQDQQLDPCSFRFPECPSCRGIIKPTIVFFGENMRIGIREAIDSLALSCDALLVLGSTCTTYSALRIVKQVKSRGKWVGMCNIGETRADPFVDVKWESWCEVWLPQVLEEMQTMRNAIRGS